MFVSSIPDSSGVERNGKVPEKKDLSGARDEWVTIAEAAQRLDVPERTLRRILTEPEYAAHTRQEARQTKTGTRQTTLLPSTLLTALATRFEKWEKPAEDGAKNAAGMRTDAIAKPVNTANNVAIVVHAYERLIDELKEALDHERQTTRNLSDALLREQTLRALPPAPPVEPAPEPEIRRPWWMFWRA
jgi:hypothetical protein